MNISLSHEQGLIDICFLMEDRNAKIKGSYTQKSIRARIEAFFLDNLGMIVTREQLIQVATDPVTGRIPENWHQRLSEPRTDKGYTIWSWRNRQHLKVSEYMMPDSERRASAAKRTRPTEKTWKKFSLTIVIAVHGRKGEFDVLYEVAI